MLFGLIALGQPIVKTIFELEKIYNKVDVQTIAREVRRRLIDCLNDLSFIILKASFVVVILFERLLTFYVIKCMYMLYMTYV